MAAADGKPSSTSIQTNISNTSALSGASQILTKDGHHHEGEGDKSKYDGPGVIRKSFEFKADRMRIKLTPIEDYEKKLIFHLNDAPSRVVSRLERLMGSDKVCLLDHDWMRELENRLDEENEKDWVKRDKQRIKGERKRYRKLAIDGHMPVPNTPDMKDIYKNPMYRVNKVIQRLSKFDYNALLNPKQNLPPLTLVDPFEKDDSGKIFKTWPGHNETIEELEKSKAVTRGSLLPPASSTKLVRSLSLKDYLEAPRSDKDLNEVDVAQDVPPQNDEPENEEGEVAPLIDPDLEPEAQIEDEENGEIAEDMAEVGEELEGEDMEDVTEHKKSIEEQVRAIDRKSKDSLESLRKQYGIDQEADLQMWEPFHSKLVEMFDQANAQPETAATELYEVGDNVVGVYNREIMVAEEACVHLSKVINAHANNLEIPVLVRPSTASIRTASMQSTSISENPETVAEPNGAEKKTTLTSPPSPGNDAK